MSNIYERIGRAISSCGEYDIVRAETKEEVEILEGTGFKKVGSTLEGENVIPLYKIETKTIEKIVQVPIISPTIKPYPPIDTSPWDNVKPWKTPNLPGIGSPWVSIEPYRATFGTGARPDYTLKDATLSIDTKIDYNKLSNVISDLHSSVTSTQTTSRNQNI